MNVDDILAAKGRGVVTMDGGRTLKEAVGVLHARRIGAVVVVDAEGAVAGILSERDVVRALGDAGAAALDEPVASRMTREVVTCTASAAIPSLMSLMTDGKFRHVPVVDDGRLGGLVSICDIVKHRLAEMEAEGRALRDYIATA